MAIAMALVLLAYGSWQLFRWEPTSDRRLIGDGFFYLVAGTAVCTSWSASRRCRLSPKLRRAWRLFSLGLLGQLAGQVAFMVYDLLGKTPYPSIADVLYLSFYPLMLVGLLSLPVARSAIRTRVQLGVDLAVVAIGSSATVVYVVLGPTLVANSGSPLQVAFSVAYPVGDMVLLVGLASVLLRGSAPSARWALRLLAAGLVLFVIGDVAYGYITLHSTYQVGDPIDTTWMVALALMAVAGTTQGTLKRPERIEATSERVSWLPPAAVATGFGILLFSDRREAFFPGVAMILIAIALAGLVLARQVLVQHDLLSAKEQLRYQAFHDALTGLPNRQLVLDRAEQLLARGHRDDLAVPALFLDIDGFKRVNDSFGHAAGDKLLQTVAERLTRVLRASDTVGRLGGDEFVILLDPVALTEAPELVAERVLAVLSEPVEISGSSQGTLSISASIGITAGLHTTADELLRDADIALYEAKDAGKGRYILFESRMGVLAEARLRLEIDLHDAIEEQQFFLVYQPTFNLETRAVAGVEALIRWRHPTRGLIAPDQFIPLAETTGMIVPIGRWVLQEACTQAAEWHRSGYPVGMAVNVSSYQLDSESFLDDVNEALALSGIDPTTLTLEITETRLMKDPDDAAERLASLKRLGVRIAIDDFGTGYGSLAYVRRFRVDALKIDRSFISGMSTSEESAAIVRSLIRLGNTLGLETFGEGIEEPAQLLQLQQEHCHFGQGFLLSRPLDVKNMNQFFQQGQAFDQPAQVISASPGTARTFV
jgi:diguanylate cyclase (GGDEF)-like protein